MNDPKNAEMLERLVKAGVAESEAQDIVASFSAQQTEETDEIDVNRLTKAMEGVKDAFDTESDTTDVDAAIQEASDIVDAVTKGADAILAEQRGQYEALSKAILTVGEELVGLKAQFAGNAETVQKSLSAVSASMDEPLLRKSVSSEFVPVPGEQKSGVVGSADLIAKALVEMQGVETNDTRRVELRQAVSLLESGAVASDVSNNYRL